VTAGCFPQNCGKIATTEAESLLDVTRNPQPGIASGNAVPLAENPHSSRPIIDLEYTGAQSTVGADYPARDGNFFVPVSSRIAIDVFDGKTLRTTRQAQNTCNQKNGGKNSGACSGH